MASQVSAVRPNRHDVPVAEIVPSKTIRSLFRSPRYLNGEAAHSLPALFWLIELVRPSQAVKLGMADGTVYFGLCQSLDRLDHAVSSYCIDTSLSDPRFDDIKRYNHDNYRDFSHLVSEDIYRFSGRLAAQTVDMLHVEASELVSDSSAAEAITREWFKTLSDRALIVLHNVGSYRDDPRVLAVSEEIVGSSATIRFDHGPGMIVVLHGADQPDALRKLAALAAGDAGYAEVRQVFSRIGELNHYEWSHRQALESLERTQMSLERARVERDAIEVDRASLRGQLETLSRAYDDRTAKTALLQSQHIDLQATLAEKIAALAESDKKRTESAFAAERLQQRLEDEKAKGSEVISALENRLAADQREIDALKATAEYNRAEHLTQLAERDLILDMAREEISTLKTAAERGQKHHETQLTERDQELAAANEALEALRAAAEANRAQHADRLTGYEQELAAARGEIASLKSQLEGERFAAAEHKLEGARLRKQIDTRFEELAILTRRLEEREASWSDLARQHSDAVAAQTSLEARLREAERALHDGSERETTLVEENVRVAHDLALAESAKEALQAQLAELSSRLERLEGNYRKIRNTTSWKITAPARNLSKSLRTIGQRGPERPLGRDR